ncbi:nucleotidyltransferase domain-containing protein [Marispirochaeta sp.]|uniref:type VII toxin-antitoxin system MntA family adenylyltransferase antitoxin n=1 Tax=Marispirochaeta sp. TaxID=2038653 RepID=UPI0029C6F091|nr:nucleotidyltransferase domain-containing protein [Marispirochaeta sp.]
MRLKNEIIQQLADEFAMKGVSIIILYGSAATDKAETLKSDVDLAVAGEELLTPEELSGLYLSASEIVQREVDIVDLRRAMGFFLKEILTKGEIILNEDPGLLGSKAEEMMDYQTDLAPGVEAMLRQRLARSLHAE